ncbi:hypothetical protein S245_063423, partial [Arachis hypogaea]
ILIEVDHLQDILGPYIFRSKPDKALELGIINSRHEAFITSKLWCNNDHHDLVLPALKTTL